MPGRKNITAGCWITVDVVRDGEESNYAVSVNSARAPATEAFAAALTASFKARGCGGDFGPEREHSVTLLCKKQNEAYEAYFFFFELLLDQELSPGVATTAFVRSFTDKYRETEPAPLNEQPMTECKAAVERIECLADEALRTEHLIQKLETKGLHPARLRQWLHVSVERCVFARVGSVIWQFYKQLHSEEDALFVQKAQAVRTMGETELLEALEVRKEFRRKSNEATVLSGLDDKSTKADSKTDSDDMASTPVNTDMIEGEPVPPLAPPGLYERAASGLSQIEAELCSKRGCTPRKAIERLISTQLELKECALEPTGGRAELCSMDDLLPLFVLVLVQSSLLHPFACSKYMQDSMNRDERLDSEGRVVLLLWSAASYITYEWNTEEISG